MSLNKAIEHGKPRIDTILARLEYAAVALSKTSSPDDAPPPTVSAEWYSQDVRFLLAELDAAKQLNADWEAASLVGGPRIDTLRAELDAARAREQALEASLHSLRCAVCREPGAKGWCQSCFDRACKEVDQARGAWAREAKLREAAGNYMSQFGQALEAHDIPFTDAQDTADRELRAALAEGEDTHEAQ